MSWLDSFFPSLATQKVTTYLFSEPTFKSWAKQFILGDNTFGYFSVAAKQGTKHCVKTLTRMNLLTILGVLGGLISTITVTIRSLMYNYMFFVIDKSQMKRLYTQRTDADPDQTDPNRSDKDEFLYRAKNRQSYSFGYLGYLSMLIVSNICCCCIGCCRESCDRRLKSFKKF